MNWQEKGVAEAEKNESNLVYKKETLERQKVRKVAPYGVESRGLLDTR